MKNRLIIWIALTAYCIGNATAGEVTGLTTFTSGTTAKAAEVNGNFDSVKTAVDDNNTRIAANENALSPSQVQFVGFSSATFNGGQGVVTYTNACQQDYPGSWMCTSKEFLESKVYPTATGVGWIRPTHVPVGIASGNVAQLVAAQDISGRVVVRSSALDTGLSCSGWQNPSASPVGLVVDSEGRFVTLPCDGEISVACCASQ